LAFKYVGETHQKYTGKEVEMKKRTKANRSTKTVFGAAGFLCLMVISLYAGTDVSWNNIASNPQLHFDPYSRTPDEEPPKCWSEEKMGPTVEDWQALVPVVEVDYAHYRKLNRARRHRTLKGGEWVQYHVGKIKFSSRSKSERRALRLQEPKLPSAETKVSVNGSSRFELMS